MHSTCSYAQLQSSPAVSPVPSDLQDSNDPMGSPPPHNPPKLCEPYSPPRPSPCREGSRGGSVG
eukprot:4755493-Prymnesium_polylepis.1